MPLQRRQLNIGQQQQAPLGGLPEIEPTWFGRASSLVTNPLNSLLEFLDKPRNIVTGLLAGKPQVLWELLPGARSFGIDVPKVSGRDLLEEYGLLDPNTPGFDKGDVAGFAADVALDPLSYLGVGALTKAGALEKAGKQALNVVKITDDARKVVKNTKFANVFDEVAYESWGKLREIESNLGRAIDPTVIPERSISFAGKDLLTFRKEINPLKGTRVGDFLAQKLKFLPSNQLSTDAYDVRKLGEEIATEGRIARLAEIEKKFEGTGRKSEDIMNFVEEAFTSVNGKPQLQSEVLNEADGVMKVLMGDNYSLATANPKLAWKKDILGISRPHPDVAVISKEQAAALKAAGLKSKRGIYDIKEFSNEVTKRLKILADYEGQWSPEELTLLREAYNDSHTDLLANLNVGVHEKLLRNPTIGYAYHLITPNGKEINKLPGVQEDFVGWFDTLTKENFSARKRNMASTVKEANTFIRSDPRVKEWARKNGVDISEFKYFEENVFKAMAVRARASYGQFFNKVYNSTIFNNHATALLDTAGNRVKGMVSLPEYIRDKELLTWGNVRFKKGDKVNAIRKKLVESGHDVNVGIRKDLLADADRPFQTVINDAATKDFFKVYDKVHSAYRGMFTVLFPQYHSRNLLGNLWNSTVLGGAKASDHLEAASILKRVRKATKENVDLGTYLKPEEIKLYNDGLAHGVLKHHDTYLKQLRDLGEFAISNEESGLFRRAMGHGQKLAHEIENSSRFGHFIGMINKGETAHSAAGSVRKYLFNYNELSSFEQRVMKRVTFFYTFTRKNTPLVFENMINPYARAWAAFVGKTDEKPEDMPDWMYDSNMLYMGLDQSRMAQGVNLGLPINDPFESIAKPLSMVTPLIGTFLEGAAGFDFFKGKPLSEDTVAPKLFQSLEKLGIPMEYLDDAIGLRVDQRGTVRIDPGAKFLLRSSPVGRLANFDFTSPMKAATSLGLPFSTSVGNPDTLNDKQKAAIKAAQSRGELRTWEIYVGSTARGKRLAKQLNQ